VAIMSEVPIHAGGAHQDAFNRGTMLLITAVGVVAFIAMLLLGAYAPSLDSGKNGGAHALSKAAVGYSGLVRLVEATGGHPVIVRSVNQLDSEDLAVVTPESHSTDLTEILDRRGPRATLIVLPKWQAVRDQNKPAWVRVPGLLPPFVPEGVLAPMFELSIARAKGRGQPLTNAHSAAPPDLKFLAPAVVQTIRGDNLVPIITDERGRILLGQIGTRPLYVLAEADLLNNHGMGDKRQAASALALLSFLNSTDSTSVLFDVTANGLGSSRSPLRLAFDPPFLAVTLTIFAAMLLAGIQALARFGAAQRPERAIAFGKAALVDNSAALIRKAGREASLGSRYVEVIRERAAALFRLPAASSPEALDTRLESLNSRRSFGALAAAADAAHNRDELLGAARSLHDWVEEVQE
jgi:hypothetical protein